MDFVEENAKILGNNTMFDGNIIRRKTDNAESYVKLKNLNKKFVPFIYNIEGEYVYQKYEKGYSLSRFSKKSFSMWEIIVITFKIIYILLVLKNSNINYGELNPNCFIVSDDNKIFLIKTGKGQNSIKKIVKFIKLLTFPDFKLSDKALKFVLVAIIVILMTTGIIAAIINEKKEVFVDYGLLVEEMETYEEFSECTSEECTEIITSVYVAAVPVKTETDTDTETTTDDGLWEMEIIPGDKRHQTALIAIDNPDLNYIGHIVKVRGPERDILERLVNGEDDSDFYAAALVAQCIRDTIVSDGYKSVTAVRRGLKYSGSIERPPSADVKKAVAYIFDKGGNAVQHRILYFYAPELVESKWHESQEFIFGYSGHKYFDRTKDANNKRIHSKGIYNTLSYVPQIEEDSEETTENAVISEEDSAFIDRNTFLGKPKNVVSNDYDVNESVSQKVTTS